MRSLQPNELNIIHLLSYSLEDDGDRKEAEYNLIKKARVTLHTESCLHV